MRQGCQQHADQDSCETDVLEHMKVQKTLEMHRLQFS